MNSSSLLLLNSSRVQPQPRAPLVFPICHSCPAPDSFDKDLTRIWSNGAPQSRDFLRGNFWGIPVFVNGVPLPFVPGGSSHHPERFLSYFFPMYPRAYQEQWFVENQLRGYTHVLFSWPDARARAHQSLSAFRADCQRAKDAGFYVHVKLWSKDFDSHDMTVAEWSVFATPIFDALNGVVDEYSCWEYDAGNLSEQPAIAVHRYLGSRAHDQGASFWCHFYPGHGFWGGGSETNWYRLLGDTCDGLDLQTDPHSDIGDTQARIVDHLRELAPTGKKLRAFEPGTPSLMFDWDHPTEDEADAFGYLTICTKGAIKPYGFGAGGRLPDGSVI